MFLFWLLLQVATLVMTGEEVSLSARFPQPPDRQATAELLVVQVMAASLLFPILLKNWTQWWLVVASAWPLIATATLLGGEPAHSWIPAAVYVTCWLTALAAWRIALSDDRSLRLAVAAAALWAIGGPVLLYLHAEFGGGTIDSPAWLAAAGPAWTAVLRLRGSGNLFVSDLVLATILGAGLISMFVKFARSQGFPDKLSTKL